MSATARAQTARPSSHPINARQQSMINSRRMSPGPGQYFPGRDVYKHPTRVGNYLGAGPTYSFGHRPQSVLADAVQYSSSPGPIYNPKSKVGAKSGATAVGTGAVGAKFGTEMRLGWEMKRQPGPGSYTPRSTARGGVVSNGSSRAGDGPSASFPRASKARAPERNLKQANFLGREFARENRGVHSPGPGAYVLEKSVTSKSGAGYLGDAPKYSMRPNVAHDGSTRAGVDRGISTDVQRRIKEGVPGPGSYSNVMPIGSSGRGTTFGRTDIQNRPEVNIFRVPYIGAKYSRENGGVHSPGPAVYRVRGTMGATDFGHNYTKQPAFSFGTAKRTC